MDTMFGKSINRNEALILIENNDIVSIVTKNGEYKHIVMAYSSYWKKNTDDILNEQSMIDLIHNMSKYCYDKNNRLYCY